MVNIVTFVDFVDPSLSSEWVLQRSNATAYKLEIGRSGWQLITYLLSHITLSF